MTTDYLWPDPEAVRTLTSVLKLPATGREQDWEIELADAAKLGEMLTLFSSGGLDLECRSALALLILFAIEYYPDVDIPPRQWIGPVREALENDPEVRNRMLSYWGFHGGQTIVAAILA